MSAAPIGPIGAGPLPGPGSSSAPQPTGPRPAKPWNNQPTPWRKLCDSVHDEIRKLAEEDFDRIQRGKHINEGEKLALLTALHQMLVGNSAARTSARRVYLELREEILFRIERKKEAEQAAAATGKKRTDGLM